MIKRMVAMASLVMMTCLSAAATDWPAFRGPTGDGVSPDREFPTEWSTDKNIRWKVKLAAPGNGSPIVSKGRVFVTVAEDQGKKRSLVCFDVPMATNSDEDRIV
jgi:hypothetical protein